MQRLNSQSKVKQVIYNKDSSPTLSNPKPTIFPRHYIACLKRNHFTRRKCLIKYKATKRTIVYIKIYKLTVCIINYLNEPSFGICIFYITNQLTRIIKGTTIISPKTQRFHKIYLKCGYFSSVLYIFGITGKLSS